MHSFLSVDVGIGATHRRIFGGDHARPTSQVPPRALQAHRSRSCIQNRSLFWRPVSRQVPAHAGRCQSGVNRRLSFPAGDRWMSPMSAMNAIHARFDQQRRVGPLVADTGPFAIPLHARVSAAERPRAGFALSASGAPFSGKLSGAVGHERAELDAPACPSALYPSPVGDCPSADPIPRACPADRSASRYDRPRFPFPPGKPARFVYNDEGQAGGICYACTDCISQGCDQGLIFHLISPSSRAAGRDYTAVYRLSLVRFRQAEGDCVGGPAPRSRLRLAVKRSGQSWPAA